MDTVAYEYPFYNKTTQNGYRLIETDNVLSYAYVPIEPFHITWCISLKVTMALPPSDLTPEDVYLIVDSNDEGTFGHFFYDCAIHLGVWKDLKAEYPHAKAYIRGEKSYKYMLMEFFGIPKEDVVLSLNHCCNKCFFMPTMTQYQPIVDDYFKRLVREIQSMAPMVEDKTIDTLFMPRQSKENYVPNNRQFGNSKELEELLLKSSEFNDVLHTDNVDHFNDQIRKIRSAKRLLLDYGSSSTVNGIFAVNSDIVIYNNKHNHYNRFAVGSYILSIIQESNRVQIVDGCHGDIMNLTIDMPYICSILGVAYSQ